MPEVQVGVTNFSIPYNPWVRTAPRSKKTLQQAIGLECRCMCSIATGPVSFPGGLNFRWPVNTAITLRG